MNFKKIVYQSMFMKEDKQDLEEIIKKRNGKKIESFFSEKKFPEEGKQALLREVADEKTVTQIMSGASPRILIKGDFESAIQKSLGDENKVMEVLMEYGVSDPHFIYEQLMVGLTKKAEIDTLTLFKDYIVIKGDLSVLWNNFDKRKDEKEELKRKKKSMISEINQLSVRVTKKNEESSKIEDIEQEMFERFG